MATYASGTAVIEIDQFEPGTPSGHPALVVLHGSGGAASYWMDQFAPFLKNFGVAVYAPHYFDKTGTQRATTELILDGRHFIGWLKGVQDGLEYIAGRPGVDPACIGVLGISLGAYLAVALGIEDRRIRAVVELSGGVPLGWEDRMRSDMAPTLILHGAQDRVVPVSEAHKLERLLKQRRLPYEIEIFPNENHWFSVPARLQLLMHVGAFLSRHLQPENERRGAVEGAA
jgi:dienelactone hydrolase